MLEIFTGEKLKKFVRHEIGNQRPRDMVTDVLDFVRERDFRYIGIVSGLSMTGKTSLLCHVISRMTDEEIRHTAFMSLPNGVLWRELEDKLNKLGDAGVSYVFIDEITNAREFVRNSQELANIFSNVKRMRIVCSGSGSLALNFATNGPIALNSVTFDTTNLCYEEWRRLHEHLVPSMNCTVVDYAVHGGILGTVRRMKVKTADYDRNADDWKKGLRRPIGLNWLDDNEFYQKFFSRAIVENLQNGLMCKRIAEQFTDFDTKGLQKVDIAREKYPLLYGLYKKGELTEILQRAVADTLHRFAASLFNVNSNPEAVEQIIKNIGKTNYEYVTLLFSPELGLFRQYMNNYLGFSRNTVKKYDKAVEDEVFNYLRDMKIIEKIEVRSTIPSAGASKRVIFTIPGLKQQFCDGLANFILKAESDNPYDFVPVEDRTEVCKHIRKTFLGWMFEDVILHDCLRKAEDEEKEYNGICINVYRFENRKTEIVGDVPFGEFDMVVQAFYQDEIQYAVFEAKCTSKSKKEDEATQCQHLENEALLEAACGDGRIVYRAVLYNGTPKEREDKLGKHLGPIRYLDASEFLVQVAEHGLMQFFDTDAFAKKIRESLGDDAEPEEPETSAMPTL